MNTTKLQVTIIVTIYYEHGMHNIAQARYATQQWGSIKKKIRHQINKSNKNHIIKLNTIDPAYNQNNT